MTVREYLIENPNKAAYTIRQGRKNYLCTIFEANSYFGSKEVKKVSYRYDSKELPLLTLA